MQGKCQGNYEAVRVKSNVKSSHRVVTFKQKRKRLQGRMEERDREREEFVNVSDNTYPPASQPSLPFYL